jgi:rubrerythrin
MFVRSLHLATVSRGTRAAGSMVMGTKREVIMDELLYQSLETELGGVQVYEKALECVQNDDLREEWQKYLDETRGHVEVVRGLLETFGLDPDAETPGRKIVRHIGKSLVKAMELALENGDPAAAEIVAAECVVEAETKDHLNWELIGLASKKLSGEQGRAVKEAFEKVEKQEDHHIYHTTGWCRELWVQSLGMRAVLPPPEERKDVETAIGAARAKNARSEMR